MLAPGNKGVSLPFLLEHAYIPQLAGVGISHALSKSRRAREIGSIYLVRFTSET